VSRRTAAGWAVLVHVVGVILALVPVGRPVRAPRLHVAADVRADLRGKHRQLMTIDPRHRHFTAALLGTLQAPGSADALTACSRLSCTTVALWRGRLFPPRCRTEHECGHCALTTAALSPSHSLLLAHMAQERSLSLQ
jgi:hypothetical protein